MEKPKVSVLMPVYNTKREHLIDAIESILSQTFRDFELIIINDHSTEQAVDDVIRSFVDSRIRYYINNANEGISSTRNKLVGYSRGEFVAVMDHDDIAEPERLAEQVEYLDAHPEIGVVASWFERFSEDKQILHKGKSDDLSIKRALMYECALLHPSSMVRRELLVSIPYEGKFSPAEDYALWCRLIPKTNFHIIPKILLRYREHETNTSKTQKGKMKKARRLIHQFVRRENLGLWNEARKEMDCVVRVKLFGVLQVAKFRHRGSVAPRMLNYIPFLTFHVKPFEESSDGEEICERESVGRV